LRAHSAMVTWNVPQGDTVIGYAISQQVRWLSVSSVLQKGLIQPISSQRQDGLMQRSIREVFRDPLQLSRATQTVLQLQVECSRQQVQSVGLHGDSQPSRPVHFRTLERTDHYPAGVLDHPVIALFCRQYDIIKDNDSNGTKEKAKRPLVQASTSYYNASAGSSPIYHNGAVHSSRVRRSLKILFFWVFYIIHDQDSVSAAEVPE
ncbi:hypothetical protein GOODEAATRI_003808, partial [Goodea atripinnis]